MACSTQSLISLNSFGSKRIPKWSHTSRGTQNKLFMVNASSTADDDCNEEECAPEKEVGKLSLSWLADEKTKVVGTFPPMSKKKGWTGYVEKDTAGQTNIYSVEPAIYVAESALSSGTAGTSSEGTENTAAVAAGFALISIAAASSILLQVNKNQTQVDPVQYTGPPLSYYISKFKPVQLVEVQTAPPVEASVPPEASSPAETGEVTVEAPVSLETSSSAETGEGTAEAPVSLETSSSGETGEVVVRDDGDVRVSGDDLFGELKEQVELSLN